MGKAFLFATLLLLTACYSISTISAPYADSKKYADYYQDFLEPESKLITAGYSWTREQLGDTTIIKQYHPDMRVLIAQTSYVGNRKNGKSKEWFDNRNIFQEGYYYNDIKTGQWTECSNDSGYGCQSGIYESGKREGEWVSLDSLGRISSMSTYKDGILNGTFKKWDKNGELSVVGEYEDGEIVNIEQGEYTDPILDTTEMPYMASCENVLDKNTRRQCSERKLSESIYKNIKYPASARENGLEGAAIITFIVTKDGSMENIRAMRGLSDDVTR